MYETLIMADSITNYATVSGFIAGLGVLLFVVRTRRKSVDKGRKLQYGSDGKPISS